WLRPAWLHFLFELPEPEGRRVGPESAGGARVLLGFAAAANPRRRHGRENLRGGIGRLFSHASYWPPARSDGFATESGDTGSAISRRSFADADGGVWPKRRCAAPAALGRLPRHTPHF